MRALLYDDETKLYTGEEVFSVKPVLNETFTCDLKTAVTFKVSCALHLTCQDYTLVVGCRDKETAKLAVEHLVKDGFFVFDINEGFDRVVFRPTDGWSMKRYIDAVGTDNSKESLPGDFLTDAINSMSGR
jgi:hypothetical protein